MWYKKWDYLLLFDSCSKKLETKEKKNKTVVLCGSIFYFHVRKILFVNCVRKKKKST